MNKIEINSGGDLLVLGGVQAPYDKLRSRYSVESCEAEWSENIRLMRGEILYAEKINYSDHGVCNECFDRDSFGAGDG